MNQKLSETVLISLTCLIDEDARAIVGAKVDVSPPGGAATTHIFSDLHTAARFCLSTSLGLVGAIEEKSREMRALQQKTLAEAEAILRSAQGGGPQR